VGSLAITRPTIRGLRIALSVKNEQSRGPRQDKSTINNGHIFYMDIYYCLALWQILKLRSSGLSKSSASKRLSSNIFAPENQVRPFYWSQCYSRSLCAKI